ncbi:hypothetical protein ACFQ48_17935 [Hymenobacter caeli]|uniref:DUF3592 domain-containing protein n=1 Tax=Hymenobacter caeli TaxID=2735894 RepID=A0ABX2FWZ1_9BACT|nr:hypothetical protein [Hymenobacter caeli]NRT20912.1 hypothetical protein [Hymenobacter caeli]
MNNIDRILERYKLSGAWLTLSLIVIIAAASEMWRYHNLSILNTRGVILHAKITNVVHSRGYNIDYNYYYKNKMYEQSSNITEFSCEAGDSLLVEVLPNDPGGKIAIMKKFYSVKEN